MIEGYRLALFFAAQHILCKYLVLLLYYLKVVGGQSSRVVRRADHGLHAKLGKAQIRHMEYVVGKVGISVGKGAAHIVIFAAPRLNEPAELGHYAVIAAIARIIYTGGVIYLLAAVQGQHHIAHLPIAELYDLVVDEHAVGGEGEAEVLAPFLLYAAGIIHKPLNHVPVHQRLTAEEVHLEIGAAA